MASTEQQAAALQDASGLRLIRPCAGRITAGCVRFIRVEDVDASMCGFPFLLEANKVRSIVTKYFYFGFDHKNCRCMISIRICSSKKMILLVCAVGVYQVLMLLGNNYILMLTGNTEKVNIKDCK